MAARRRAGGYVAPRETYARLERSRTIPRLDQRNTWSVVCFYLDLSVAFLRAAVDYARAGGAEVVEGYPVDPVVDEAGNWGPPKSYRFMGYTSTFLKAGFQDGTPEGNPQRVMRYKVG